MKRTLGSLAAIGAFLLAALPASAQYGEEWYDSGWGDYGYGQYGEEEYGLGLDGAYDDEHLNDDWYYDEYHTGGDYGYSEDDDAYDQYTGVYEEDEDEAFGEGGAYEGFGYDNDYGDELGYGSDDDNGLLE